MAAIQQISKSPDDGAYKKQMEHTPDDLREYFPKMTPIKRQPILFTINGVGTRMAGHRDEHAGTGTYVKTHCICFLFIPVFALGAYRVLDAPEGGWYFLGKEPLSGFAQFWNRVVLLSLIAMIGGIVWQSYINTPAAIAARKLSAAAACEKKQKLDCATRLYLQVARDQKAPAQARKARKALFRQLKETLPQASSAAAARFFRRLQSAYRRSGWMRGPDNAIFTPQGKQLAHKWEATAPRHSLMLLTALQSWAPKHEQKALLRWRQRLLERLTKQHPKDAQLASELAVCYEKTEHCKRCEALLTPHAAHLGTLEGARILGIIYAKKKRHQASTRLLRAYVKVRLKQLHRAQKRYNAANQAARQRALHRLKHNKGPKFFYTKRFQNLPKQEQQRRMFAYLEHALKRDLDLNLARENLLEAARIVPLAMTLGISMLHHARSLHRAARRRELQATERLFLGLQGVAGRSIRYKLYLGQVYYWLGKQQKGRQLFDQVLRKTHRSPGSLLHLAHILRAVGERDRAFKLSKEAYQKSAKQRLKYNAALFCGLTAPDNDAKLRWLKRADLAVPGVSALLYNTLADRAAARGERTQAAKFYRRSIKAYEKMNQSASQLNNSGLSYLSLAQLTGSIQAFREGIKRMRAAIALQPGDSILLHNAAASLQRAAIFELVLPKLQLYKLRLPINSGLLSFLYQEQRGRKKIVQRLLAHPAFQESRAMYQKVLLLAPNNPNVYTALSALYRYTDDLKGMQALVQQLKRAKLDLTQQRAERKALYAGQRDHRFLRTLTREIRRIQYQQKRLRSTANKRTQAVLQVYYLYNLVSAAKYGQKPRPRLILKLARSAYAATPSSSTRQALILALMFDAAHRLSQRHPLLARYLQHCRRALSVTDVLAMTLLHEPKLAPQWLRDPSLQRAIQLTRTQELAFPAHFSPRAWAFLQATDPLLAKRIAKHLQNDQLDALERTLEHQLNPLSASALLRRYFAARATHKPKLAKRLLQQALDLGIPLPTRASLASQATQ